MQEVIKRIDVREFKTKVSKEKSKVGKYLYSPSQINRAFKDALESMGWSERRNTFYVTANEQLLRDIYRLSIEQQKSKILAAGLEPILTYNQTDFVKERVAIEVQFGKYAFVAHDLFIKHLSFYESDIIDVGIEILPMKEMEKEMSRGVPYYERDLLNVLRQGRGVPAVPLVMVGVKP